MRRRVAAVVAVVLLASVAGCGLPEGVDGDLVNGWAKPPVPQGWTPGTGTCHEKVVANLSQVAYTEVACTEPHAAEAYYTGELTSGPGSEEDADQITPGALAPAARVAAAAQCSKQAAAFLGGDWQSGKLSLHTVLPSRAAWKGGARWFRCDVAESDVKARTPLTRRGSLAKSMTGAAPAKLGCFNPTMSGNSVMSMPAAPCTAGHTSEFAGVWQAPASARTLSAVTSKQMGDGCIKVIASWAKLPNDRNITYRVGWIAFAPDYDDWELGFRGVRCFLWINGKKMTGSYRGAGTGKLGINYG